jgi:hypothetical protein
MTEKDPIDRKLTDYLSRAPLGGRTLGLSAEDCYRYLAGEMEGGELERFLKALRSDHDAQELLAAASKVPPDAPQAPASLRKKAKSLWRAPKALCPHCGKAVTALKKPLGPQTAVLAACAAGLVLFFGLSFVFPRYFMQLLLLAGLCGFKAIVDLKTVKTQILVYKAMSEVSTQTDGGSLHNHPGRL